jgi:hypothetical protein
MGWKRKGGILNETNWKGGSHRRAYPKRSERVNGFLRKTTGGKCNEPRNPIVQRLVSSQYSILNITYSIDVLHIARGAQVLLAKIRKI